LGFRESVLRTAQRRPDLLLLALQDGEAVSGEALRWLRMTVS